MLLLGFNAYHGDSSACLVSNGELIAAAREERFRRIKHWAGFPSEAIRYCLDESNLKFEQIDYIALYRNPRGNLLQKHFLYLVLKIVRTTIRDLIKGN